MQAMSADKVKMLSGESYSPLDSQLVADRLQVKKVLEKIRVTEVTNERELALLIKELLPNAAKDIRIEFPFVCDYGYNITTGKRVFINYNCIFLDAAPITIGKHVLIGPGVHIYTATHPTNAIERQTIEFAKPVSIGNDCWIGGNSVICPGVTIGDGCTIGAGSVVTKNIPDNSLAVGNPAKVIKTLEK